MAKQATPATDFDEELEEQTRPASVPATPKDVDGMPYCPKHHCRMRQTSGGPAGAKIAHVCCPVDGCSQKAKRVKSQRCLLPLAPMTCQRCSGLSPQPIMERSDKLSTGMYSILQCPVCGHKSAPMPLPEFVVNHQLSRGRVLVEDIGTR